MNNQTNTETQTQPQADVEKELDLDLFDVLENLESNSYAFDTLRTVLGEMANDLMHTIKLDGSKEDEKEIRNLAHRQPVLDQFCTVAIDYVIRLQDVVETAIHDIHAYIKQEK